MNKNLTKKDRIRLSFQLYPNDKELLENLCDRSDATSLTETIRRALALYDLFLEHRDSGGDVVFRHKKGDRKGEEEVLHIL